MTNITNVFSQLTKSIRKLITEKGFKNPTDPQNDAIPLILNGENVLLIAPTGTGKTEAAILPILSNFIELQDRSSGIKILYITPLRALNRDLLERFGWWCGRLDIKLAVRHGDTETSERLHQSQSPPQIMITTPETLQAILPGRRLRRHLKTVRWVIIDEIHELAEEKRGSLLSLTLERLRFITEQEFQIVGLSATIGSPKKIAQFLVGTDRMVNIVKVPVARNMKLDIICPSPLPEDHSLAKQLYTHPEVAARLRIMRTLIEKHTSVLVFTNTRSMSEVLTSRFKFWDINFPISIHHGSLAKPARIIAERQLKNGSLKSLVCTSSLELGIDIGSIDLCLQYMSPRQVTRLLQRVGRSGHGVGRIAKGTIITIDSDDTLETLVIARRSYQEDLESVKIPEKPLDAMAIQIVGLLFQKSRWDFKEILELFKQAYPYRNLDEEDLIRVLQYMHARHPRLVWVSFDKKIVLKPKETKNIYTYYYDNLSMIPDVKKYLVISQTDNSPLGILDEAFIAEYGDPGTKFIIQGCTWRIINVYRNNVYVEPIDDPTGAVPSWIGEQIPVPFEIAREVGKIRALVEEKMDSDSFESIVESLSNEYLARKDTILKAIAETAEQVKKGLQVPTDIRITVESWSDYIIIHSSFGNLVNRTLAILLDYQLSERTGCTFEVRAGSYRILIHAPLITDTNIVVETLLEISRMDITKKLISAISNTNFLKRRLINVSRKFGALSKSVDFGNISLGQLKKYFEGDCIFEEALKETFVKDIDVKNTMFVLDGIQSGDIEIVLLNTGGEATPIACLGIKKIGRITNLISPDKMKSIMIKSAKSRLWNTAKTFVCTTCRNFIQIIHIRDLPDKLVCPNCSSEYIGVLDETEITISRLFSKRNTRLSFKEKKIQLQALETAKLMSVHGKIAAIILAGRNLGPLDVKQITSEENILNDSLFKLIIEAEKKVLLEKF